MPINAVCPECQTRFRLQDGMAGKLMRCTACQEMFLVKDAGPGAAPAAPGPEKVPPVETAPRTRTDAPAVVSRSGNVTDFVQVIRDVSPVPAPVAPRETTWSEKGGKPPATEFPWDEGPRGKPRPAPKEVLWAPEVAPPGGPPPLPAISLDPVFEVEVLDPPGETLLARPARPSRTILKRRRRRFGILVLLILFSVAALGSGGYFIYRYINTTPERLMAAGKKDYDAGNYPQARKVFDEIVREHPSHRLAPEAKFRSDLSSLRQVVGAVTSAQDPQPALNEWAKFLAGLEDDQQRPFAAKDVLGVDIWHAGVKLQEDLLIKGTEAAKTDPNAAEKWLNDAAAVERDLDRFRPDDLTDPARLKATAVALRNTIQVARDRLAKLATLEKFAGETDEALQRFADEARKLGIDKDPVVIARLDELHRRIEGKAAYTREPNPIPPTAVPDDGLTSLLFAPRFDRGNPRQITWTPTVFFCQARGVLYALDEADGRVRWAARTGLDTDIMPVRVPATDQNPEMVLVASNTGNQFGITARGARDGRPLWHQPLAVPCQGQPAIVGPNAYVSLGDATGTVLEIALATGDIVGRITIGRALGPTIAARAGTGYLYVPGDAQAVYVFDVYRHDPDGKKLEPVLLGTMTTRHPRGSLRGVPVFSNPDPNEPGPKFLVLGQADGLDTMKLRAFRLPEGPDGRPVGEPESKEILIAGWASFPPHCDGEKVAVVTDQGQFGLYGLKLDGNNADENLFAFPAKPRQPGDARPSRGQVVLAEEGMFWILAGGELRKFRFGINQGEGVRLIPSGDPIAAGEPLQDPQVNARRDMFTVVTQDGMTCRATAVDSRTGEVRWRRELGLMAKGDPLRVGNSVVLMDQAGGFYRIDDTTKLAAKGSVAWLVEERWLVAQPARGYTAYTGIVRGPSDTAIAVLTGEKDHIPQLLIRQIIGDEVVDRGFGVAGPPAGVPVVSGHMLVIPLTDGNLYRLNLADRGAKLEQGPAWRGERLPATSTCYLTPLNEDELYATDGARSVVRRHWPAANKSFEGRGGLRLPDRPAATPVVLPTSPPRLVLADAQGKLTMIDGDKMKLPAMTVWRPGTNMFPAGPITAGLRLHKAADGSVRIAYTADGKLVWLSPDANAPEWVGPPALKAVEGQPVVDGNRVLLTDRAGVVRVLDPGTGKETGEEFRLSGSHAFASAAVPVGPNRILVPLADGTVVLGELKVMSKEEPKADKK